MPQLVDVLAEVLRSFGYRTTIDAQPAPGEPAYQVPLWAEKDGRTVAVEFWYEPDSPGASFLDAFHEFLDETRADHGILVSFGGSPDLDSGDGRLTVWGPDRVRDVLGAAVLDETCPGLIDRADPMTEPPAPTSFDEEEGDAVDALPGPIVAFDVFDAGEADPTPTVDVPDVEPAPALADAPTPETADEPATPPVAAADDGDGMFEMLPGRDDEREASEDVETPATPDAVEPAGDEKPFEMLPGRDDEPDATEPAREAPVATDAAEPSGDEKPFEMLPGRDDEREASEGLETPATPDAVEPAGDEKPFEMLPGRDDEPEGAEPADAPEAIEASPEATGTDAADADGDAQPFEMLPGRAESAPDEAAAGAPERLPGRPRDTRDADAAAAPTAPQPGAAAGTDFELLAGRAAAGADEAASPDDASAGGYDELPGRDESPAGASPAIPVDSEGRGYEELPGRHEAPPPEESAGSFDATGDDGRDFEVMGDTDEDEKADAEPTSDASEAPDELQVPPAFSADDDGGDPGVLRLEVGRKVAHNLVKDKIRDVREERLRLIPHLIFTYEADILVDGKLDAETKRGRVGVDAWMKRAHVWQHGTDTAPLDAGGADVERLKVRIGEDEARQIVLSHLEDLVGREVTEEQESDEWSVVVKRRVRLAEDDVRIRYEGTYWLPVWRLAGAEGSVEIDAAGGEVLDEEILVEHSDSQLL